MGARGEITFGGLFSGLPTNELIDSLVELQRRPIDLMEARRQDFKTRLEILTDLSNRTRTLRDALRTFDNLANSVERNDDGSSNPSLREEFRRFSATSSDPAILTATASGAASPGTLRVQVNQLAREEREVSEGYADRDTTTVGTGTFSITVGSAATVDITIDSSNNTLDKFVAAINDSGADVSAFVLDDGDAASPYRVVISGNETGLDQGITLTDTLGGGTAPVFTERQAAQDAQLYLDPGDDQVVISRPTNEFGEVMPGVSIDAISAAPGTDVTIRVDEDVDSIVEAMAELVAAYNSVADLIAEQTKIDPATNRGGPLIGDGTVVRLQRQLSMVFAQSYGSGSVTTTGQLGLALDRNGHLSLDSDELRAALSSDIEAAAEFFAGSGSFADELRAVADAFVRPVSGGLVVRIDGASQSIASLDDDIAQAEDRLERFESDLVRQFSALESNISGIQAQGNFLNQFLVAQTAS